MATLQSDTEWFPVAGQQFTDRRYIMGRTLSDGTERADHYRNVRAYRGVIARRKNGKQEYDRCPHAHRKPGAARECAKRAAKRLNKLPDGEWPKGEA